MSTEKPTGLSAFNRPLTDQEKKLQHDLHTGQLKDALDIISDMSNQDLIALNPKIRAELSQQFGKTALDLREAHVNYENIDDDYLQQKQRLEKASAVIQPHMHHGAELPTRAPVTPVVKRESSPASGVAKQDQSHHRG